MFDLLVHSPNICKGQGWVGPRPGVLSGCSVRVQESRHWSHLLLLLTCLSGEMDQKRSCVPVDCVTGASFTYHTVTPAPPSRFLTTRPNTRSQLVL